MAASMAFMKSCRDGWRHATSASAHDLIDYAPAQLHIARDPGRTDRFAVDPHQRRHLPSLSLVNVDHSHRAAVGAYSHRGHGQGTRPAPDSLHLDVEPRLEPRSSDSATADSRQDLGLSQTLVDEDPGARLRHEAGRLHSRRPGWKAREREGERALWSAGVAVRTSCHDFPRRNSFADGTAAALQEGAFLSGDGIR